MFLKEGKQFVAYTPVLDLSTYADTFAKVKARFSEVVQIFFEELENMGTTDEVLKGLGWVKHADGWNAPMQVGHEIEQISVPLHA